MADEQLRILERSARATKDLTDNERLKIAQRRAGQYPIGITNIRETESEFIISDMLHEGRFINLAWAKAITKEPKTQEQHIKSITGWKIWRYVNKITRQKQWELPDIKIIYSTIKALNALLRHSEQTASAQKLAQLFWSANLMTGTKIHNSRDPANNTIIHRVGTKFEQSTPFPRISSFNNFADIISKKGIEGKLASLLLLAFFGTRNREEIKTEIAQFTSTDINRICIYYEFNTSVEIADVPELETSPITIKFNKKFTSQEQGDFTINSSKSIEQHIVKKLFEDEERERAIEPQAQTLPVKYL